MHRGASLSSDDETLLKKDNGHHFMHVVTVLLARSSTLLTRTDNVRSAECSRADLYQY